MAYHLQNDLNGISFQTAVHSVYDSIRSLHISNDIQKYAYVVCVLCFFKILFSYLNSFNKGITLSIKAVQFFSNLLLLSKPQSFC